MKLYTTEAIVIRSIKLREADRILTLISPEYGRIEAVAKGVRRTKSKFGSRLEPLSYAKLLLHRGKDLDLITQAETVTVFRPLREDLNRLAYAMSMAETTDKVLVHSESARELFGLLKKCLSVLNETAKLATPAQPNEPMIHASETAVSESDSPLPTPDPAINASETSMSPPDTGFPPVLIAVAFDIKLLALTGFDINLSDCSICESPIPSDVPAALITFSHAGGGIICDNCAGKIRENGADGGYNGEEGRYDAGGRPSIYSNRSAEGSRSVNSSQSIKINGAELKLMRFLRNKPFSDIIEKLSGKSIPEKSLDLLSSAIRTFLVQNLDIKLRSREFIKQSKGKPG